MSDLKPCPFCGSSDLTVFGTCVWCNNCDAAGPGWRFLVNHSERMPRERWNTRADQEAVKRG